MNIKCHWCNRLLEDTIDLVVDFEYGCPEGHSFISFCENKINSYLIYYDIGNIRYRIKGECNKTYIDKKDISSLRYSSIGFGSKIEVDFIPLYISDDNLLIISNNFVERINKLLAFY